MAYKTPGVYLEEIPKLPPSVAQVETAIPAFIGFTQIADDIAPDDLIKKPKRIGSLVEYVRYYGEGPPLKVSDVNIDDTNNFKSATIGGTYYLYDSLRMFFANGGGDCYIVSVGKYGTAVSETLLLGGLTALEKEDPPTLLLFPDAVSLTGDGLYNIQNQALLHCADEARMDRFAILDLHEKDMTGDEFRTKTGIKALSYGAAYSPWIKVTLPKKVTYPDVASVIKRNGVAVTLRGLTTDVKLQAQIDKVAAAYKDKKTINDETKNLAAEPDNLRSKFVTLAGTAQDTKTVTAFENLIKYVMTVVIKLDDFLETGNSLIITNTDLYASVKGAIGSTFKDIAKKIIKFDKTAKGKWAAGYTTQAGAGNFTDDVWGAGLVTGVNADAAMLNGADDGENVLILVNALKPVFEDLVRSYLSLVVRASDTLASDLDKGLEISFPVYKNILRGVGSYITSMPPSGAVAGIYAYTDRTRGVWKAPANTSISNVVEPVYTFSKTELENLNVDVNAGKSINAIRSFFGKGTLVYGARTLAGNDNEWRYVPVRRLFIMAEESVKKASEQFVFEPNDANTWVKVQAMIENFLHNIWRQGALQGAKPDHAFYVSVGLGKTMNPIDILEGRMIIEIGMAAVRPAEFIVLRFSHKMAES